MREKKEKRAFLFLRFTSKRSRDEQISKGFFSYFIDSPLTFKILTFKFGDPV